MVMGLLNIVTVMVLLFAVRPLSLPVLLVAAGVAVTSFVAMLLAPAFPGTAWSDPDFDDSNPRPLGIPVQKLLSMVAIGVTVVAVSIAVVWP
jgi:hypothetical protein